MKDKILKYVAIALVMVFISGHVHADAINSQSKLDRVTIFNDVSDYFATFGKSEQEKKRIKRKRKIKRRKRRLKKQREKKQAEYQRLIRGKKKSIWPWNN